jgi:hypothetical protein
MSESPFQQYGNMLAHTNVLLYLSYTGFQIPKSKLLQLALQFVFAVTITSFGTFLVCQPLSRLKHHRPSTKNQRITEQIIINEEKNKKEK